MSANSPKVGLLTLSILPQWSPLPKEALDIIAEHSSRAEQVLGAHGLEVIRIEELISDSRASVQKAQQLREAGIHCVIFMMGAWPPPAAAIDAIEKLDKRVAVILWAFPDLTVLPLVPACHFHGAFDDLGIEHTLLYGAPEDRLFIETIKTAAKASQVAMDLRGMRLGIFGGRYLDMYTGMADMSQVKKVFGVDTPHIDEFWLVKEAERTEEEEVRECSRLLHAKYANISTPPDVEAKSIRLYLAMKKYAKEYDLDFATVKCMPEVHGDYCSHCLSVALNISEGFVISCECDINAALTMQILKMVSDLSPGFGDVCSLDMQDGTLRLGNCGAFATDLAAKPDDIHFMEQYDNLVPSGPGTGMTTSFFAKPGRVTLARLARVQGEYVMQTASGEAIQPPRERLAELRDRLPQTMIRLDGEPEVFLRNCRSNHMHWVYGEHRAELRELCRIVGITEIAC